jgi:hypothetical protein
VSHGQRNGFARRVISVSQTRSLYFSIQVTPLLYSRGRANPVPDPLLLRKSASAGNRTRDLWIWSQELRPVDHRGGLTSVLYLKETVQSRKPIQKVTKGETKSGNVCIVWRFWRIISKIVKLWKKCIGHNMCISFLSTTFIRNLFRSDII